jgi:hypothetical protein
MAIYTSVLLKPEEKKDLQATAAIKAKQAGVNSLSVRQLVLIMHEHYKKIL